MRANAATIGGAGLIAARGLELGEHLAQCSIDRRWRIAFIARAPQRNGRMIAIAQHLVAHVGDVGLEIGGVRTVVRVGLEELVPDENAVLVAELVKVLACALTYPIANQIE